ncbi:MAG: YidC/Oxa1 family membrane protein insertase [Actinomycetota bacterium]
MLDPLYSAIGWLLAFFYSFFPNESWGLGVAIILLTCTVMLVLFPLTAKQTRSMIAMQRAAPEIKRIQQQYKDDRQKQNEEILKFYQENKINPLSGCLPLLAQSPIFIALFGVLRNPQDHVPTGTGRLGRLYTDVCGGPDVAKAACDQIDKAERGLRFLSMNLSIAPSQAGEVADAFIERIPYYMIIALVVALGYYQARQTQVRQKKHGTGSSNPAMQAQMQIISKVFPVLFGFITWGFPSGVGIYWVTSSAWRIGQQQLVLNKFYDDPPGAGAGGAKPAKPTPGTPGTGSSTARPGTPPRPHPRSKAKRKRKR